MKTILVTGGSRGIGAEICRVLGPGNKVLVHYNSSAAGAAAVAAEVTRAGGTAFLVQADLRSPAGCQAIMEQVTRITSSLDVLINNAGGLIKRHHVEEIDWEILLETFAVNTFAAMFLTKLCVPLLRFGSDPVVVNITSVSMRYGAPTATAYGASKGAIDTFTRGAASELAPHIRVNAVAPGVIEVPDNEAVTTAEHLAAFRSKTPLKKNGLPHHVAAAVKLLVENDFATGETIDINGGLSMR